MRKLLYVDFDDFMAEGAVAVWRKLRELDPHAPEDPQVVTFRPVEVRDGTQVAVTAEYAPTEAGAIEDLWFRADNAYGDNVRDEDATVAYVLHHCILTAGARRDHNDLRVKAVRELTAVYGVLKDILTAWRDPNPYDNGPLVSDE